MSARALTQFIKAPDGMKLYFLQSDIHEFNKSKDQLDDQITKGDISFAYTVFNRLLQRIDEAGGGVDELLKENFDFTADEVLTHPRNRPIPRRPPKPKSRRRKRLKYDLLVLKSDKAAKKEDPERTALAAQRP